MPVDLPRHARVRKPQAGRFLPGSECEESEARRAYSNARLTRASRTLETSSGPVCLICMRGRNVVQKTLYMHGTCHRDTLQSRLAIAGRGMLAQFSTHSGVVRTLQTSVCTFTLIGACSASKYTLCERMLAENTCLACTYMRALKSMRSSFVRKFGTEVCSVDTEFTISGVMA